MATGIVRWFAPRRGTGPVVLDDGREVPVRRVQTDGGGSQSLHASDRADFDLPESEAGPVVSGAHRL